MLEKFYTERVFPLINMTEEEFWEMKMLEFRDWRGKHFKKTYFAPPPLLQRKINKRQSETDSTPITYRNFADN